MKISELIEQLELQKQLHGDCLVKVYKPSGLYMVAVMADVVNFDHYYSNTDNEPDACIVIAP